MRLSEVLCIDIIHGTLHMSFPTIRANVDMKCLFLHFAGAISPNQRKGKGMTRAGTVKIV